MWCQPVQRALEDSNGKLIVNRGRMPNALIIVAKAPVVGQVKTRLCPPLSQIQATNLFRCFLLDLMERVCTLPDVQVYIAFTPADSELLFRAMVPFPVRYIPQRGDSFGERQLNAFADLLGKGFTRLVLIGSDIPTLPLAHVREAFSQLEDPTCDVVFAPSSDGGYHLVGVRAIHRVLFEHITWSTALVLEQMLTQARRHGLKVTLVPAWYDVDTREDLYKLAAELSHNSSVDAPRTRMCLTQLGLCSG